MAQMASCLLRLQILIPPKDLLPKIRKETDDPKVVCIGLDMDVYLFHGRTNIEVTSLFP